MRAQIHDTATSEPRRPHVIFKRAAQNDHEVRRDSNEQLPSLLHSRRRLRTRSSPALWAACPASLQRLSVLPQRAAFNGHRPPCAC